MTAPLLTAYHGDPAIKAKYLARVEAHRRADHIIQGTGWAYGRGCAIGCTLDAYDHTRYPLELGIPVEIAHLEDAIFEGLPLTEARDWPAQVLRAVRPGADLSLVWPRFAVWLLDVHLRRWRTPASQQVVRLHRRVLAGHAVTDWTPAWAVTWHAARAAVAATPAGAARAAGAACAARAAASDAAGAVANWTPAGAAWNAARAAGAVAWAAAAGAIEAGVGAAEVADWTAVATARVTGAAGSFRTQARRLLALLRAAPTPSSSQ